MTIDEGLRWAKTLKARHSELVSLRNENSKETSRYFGDREVKIAVVGLGYVGLPLVNRFLESGFQVIGFDIDQRKVDLLNSGRTYIEHIDATPIIDGRKRGKFEATINEARLSVADVIIICVPTPLD